MHPSATRHTRGTLQDGFSRAHKMDVPQVNEGVQNKRNLNETLGKKLNSKGEMTKVDGKTKKTPLWKLVPAPTFRGSDFQKISGGGFPCQSFAVKVRKPYRKHHRGAWRLTYPGTALFGGISPLPVFQKGDRHIKILIRLKERRPKETKADNERRRKESHNQSKNEQEDRIKKHCWSCEVREWIENR